VKKKSIGSTATGEREVRPEGDLPSKAKVEVLVLP